MEIKKKNLPCRIDCSRIFVGKHGIINEIHILFVKVYKIYELDLTNILHYNIIIKCIEMCQIKFR